MIGSNCTIYSINHADERTDVPICLQGYTLENPVVIEDDVWIGGNCTIIIDQGIHIHQAQSLLHVVL